MHVPVTDPADPNMSASSTTAYGFACGGGCEEDVVSEVSRTKKILASSNPLAPHTSMCMCFIAATLKF